MCLAQGHSTMTVVPRENILENVWLISIDESIMIDQLLLLFLNVLCCRLDKMCLHVEQVLTLSHTSVGVDFENIKAKNLYK